MRGVEERDWKKVMTLAAAATWAAHVADDEGEDDCSNTTTLVV